MRNANVKKRRKNASAKRKKSKRPPQLRKVVQRNLPREKPQLL
jgi:hypothetical protein